MFIMIQFGIIMVWEEEMGHMTIKVEMVETIERKN